MNKPVDVAIIGGGYYGCYTALIIKRLRPHARVLVLESKPALFTRASSTNQGQLHMGYLYSAYPELAKECAEGAREFEAAFGAAINQQTEAYYAVHKDSEISPSDYQDFAQKIGLPCEKVNRPDIFGDSITAVYKTAEKTLSNKRLQTLLLAELQERGVEVRTNYAVKKIMRQKNRFLLHDGTDTVEADQVYNAAFADSNGLHTASGIAALPLEHAVLLHFGIRLPAAHKYLAAFVVRGPFATISPNFEDQAFSHVLASGRYRNMRTAMGQAPSESLSNNEIIECYQRVLAEATPYLPVLRNAEYIQPIIGTRTNYIDPHSGASSKAVVLADYDGLKGYHVVLGGKVSCLFEIVAPITLINRDFMA